MKGSLFFCVPSSRKNNKKGKLVKLRDTHAKFFKEREKQQITFPDSASDILITQNRLKRFDFNLQN